MPPGCALRSCVLRRYEGPQRRWLRVWRLRALLPPRLRRSLSRRPAKSRRSQSSPRSRRPRRLRRPIPRRSQSLRPPPRRSRNPRPPPAGTAPKVEAERVETRERARSPRRRRLPRRRKRRPLSRALRRRKRRALSRLPRPRARKRPAPSEPASRSGRIAARERRGARRSPWSLLRRAGPPHGPLWPGSSGNRSAQVLPSPCLSFTPRSRERRRPHRRRFAGTFPSC
jgi:hypothetical protein